MTVPVFPDASWNATLGVFGAPAALGFCGPLPVDAEGLKCNSEHA